MDQLADFESQLMVAGWGAVWWGNRWGKGIVRESEIDMHTPLYLKWTDFPRGLLGASTRGPTHDKVMWESSGGQGEPELKGCPSGPA